MIREFQGKKPRIKKPVFVAPSAEVIGDVEIGENSSVWFNSVLRGDEAPIRIGRNTNIQDNSTVHVCHRRPTTIGDNVTVGHSCIIHGCTISSDCIIGMGAVVLNNAEIGRQSIVGAGAVVMEGERFPPRSLVVGIPAKAVRKLTDKDIKKIKENAEEYLSLKNQYM
jgi:carbonic anhydrase/acetyltransferase-like protein (isoleucine patch superfamily)